MSTQPIEKKRTRESFIPALKKIAKRLSEKQVYLIKWKDNYSHVVRESEIRAKALWVFGSWARGALKCGDLDLLLEVAIEEGFHPPEKAIIKKIAGSAPDVRIYMGTPEENSSHAVIEGAVLIWSPSHPKWESNIDSIKPDPSAGSYSRLTDSIPLRNEQLSQDIGQLENLVNLHEQGILDWSWVEAETIIPDESNWPEEAKKFLKHRIRFLGKKTAAVWPFLVEYIVRKYSGFDWSTVEFDDGQWMQSEGVHAVTGIPSVPYQRLDDISCSELIIASHHSRRGPNGLWVIKRGKTHPLEIQFGGAKAYYVMKESDKLPWINYWGIDSGYTHRMAECAAVIRLFTSKEDAEQAAKWAAGEEAQWQMEEGLTVSEETYVASDAIGSDLLKMISKVDAVEVDNLCLAITTKGKKYFATEELSFTTNPDDLRKYLS